MSRITPELENRLSEARRAAGATQEELARASDVSRQTIGAIEKGDYNPSTVLALRISSLLGVPVDELFWLPSEVAAELAQWSASSEDEERTDG